MANLEQFLFYMLFGMTAVKMGGERNLGRVKNVAPIGRVKNVANRMKSCHF